MIMWKSTHQRIVNEKNLAALKVANELRQARRSIEMQQETIEELNAEIVELKNPKPRPKKKT